MNTSMGMLEGTPPVPMGDDYGASLGRGMGVASASDMATTNGPLSEHAMHNAKSEMQMGPGMQMGHAMSPGEVAANANSVPNFPQDAFMEGSMMNMDAMVATPANAGLLPGWSAQMQGMMTLIRVLPQPDYDRMMEAIRNHESDEMRMPGMNMKGGSR
jgi:manganese oxidase